MGGWSKRVMGQKGFFDVERRLEAISAKGDPLETIKKIVPWEDFRADIEVVTETKPEERKSNAGRKPYDAILKFKIVVLQSLHNLSDEETEYLNGFCVLRIKVRGQRELITVVGHAAVISAGEWVTASGEWVNDRTHGQQFKARFLKTSEPTSLDGIERYLGSGMIRGIGPVYAKKLVRAFGEKVFDTIEAEPDRLREVTGIGPVRAKRITDAWAEQKIVREIMVFLHSHGVGTARAVRIYKTYGSDAVQVMTENPYRLARDIRGIGFKTADAIAMKLGIEKTAMIRVRAGISYALTEAMDEGHCGLPAEELMPLAVELLEVPGQLIQTALDLELAERTVIADTVGETACIFLAGLYRAEQVIAERILRLANGKLPWLS